MNAIKLGALKLALAILPVSLAVLAPALAQAEFGLSDPNLAFVDSGGASQMQAGSHPFALSTTFEINTRPDPGGKGVLPDEEVKEIKIDLPPGLVGTPNPVPQCASTDFLKVDENHSYSYCPASTAVGTAEISFAFGPVPSPQSSYEEPSPVFNLAPAPGVASKIGFIVKGDPVTIETGVNPNPPYNLVTHVTSIPNFIRFYGSRVTLWGVPADPAHDDDRGACLATSASCPVNLPEVPFLTLPRSCTGPLPTIFEAESWQTTGKRTSLTTFTNDGLEPRKPIGVKGCERLRFGPSITARPTSLAAQSPTGLDFSLDVNDEGLTSPNGLAQADLKRAEVTLPEGMTTNPSLAEGLNACTESDLAKETAGSSPGAGCPNASKIGTVEVETPLLDESLSGSLFIAKPYDNPFGSLLALYMVIKNPTLGIVIKQPMKVESDPVTGRITTIADNLPQLPFSHFRLHFREGTRSPLATPPGCGTFKVNAKLTPSSGAPAVTTDTAFEIVSGPSGAGCPSGGTPLFKPGLVAGTLNNAAGSYSPFYLRLSRSDGEQEFTHFSIKLPPGISGKLAGIPFCPEAAIAAARARTGSHGGQEELDSPSCPAASEVGRTLVGTGVGPSLAYVPGKVYLAGPYNGSAMSIVAVTAAKVGPFDLGTVVVRQALKVNPETAEVFVDATGSDPIPHIIEGIPVHARDIRVYVDRPDFVLNPTNCRRTSTASTLLGSGTDFASAADDQPFTVTSPFQAADCASLDFKPKLALSLNGGTKRGDNPIFKAVLTARKGDANIGRAQVTLPHSAFLDQSHIRTICTRVQFNAGTVPGENCPPGSVYGYASAVTPLLDEPIQGPVFLRSSSHPLPDLVAALHSGKIDINLVGRIDSVKGGRIRNTFEGVPDAPVTKFTLTMRGGNKGLLVNSTNLCRSTNRAIADFTGQNGRQRLFQPVLKPKCPKARSSRKARNQGRAANAAG